MTQETMQRMSSITAMRPQRPVTPSQPAALRAKSCSARGLRRTHCFTGEQLRQRSQVLFLVAAHQVRMSPSLMTVTQQSAAVVVVPTATI